MQALLRRLAARYDLVLVSDHAFEWVDHIRRVHPFLGLFRQHFFSCDLGRIKRDPGTFDHVLREIDRAPERCFFIDDNPKNIAAAAEAGIAGVVFESAAQLEAELRRRGLLDGEAA
jgi:FMN phosphatase YigB (HAD superfamily)